ncbi:MAG: translocation/assembly module TamB [Flavobacteriales bacterium]|nr:translocation/assembly module TamB [Flavobacteriales bacterium]
MGGTLGLASYNTPFQTFFARQYLNALAKDLHTVISVERVSVSLFDNVSLHHVYIEDLEKDTLLYVDHINVDIQRLSFGDKVIILDEVELNQPYFNLKKLEDGTNLTFLINHFASKDTTKGSWEFAMNEVVVNQGRFDYNNRLVDPIAKGIDYNHIGLKGLDADIVGISLNDGITCSIQQLSLQEKSGFQLDDFMAAAKVSPQGIFTEDLTIKTPGSTIRGRVGFATETYADLADFIEAVKVDAEFVESNLDVKDLAYFVPATDQLNKTVRLNGLVKGRLTNLKGRKLALVFNDGTRFAGNIDLSGLPNPEDMFWHVDVKELTTTKERMETFPLFPFDAGKFVALPDNFRHLGAIRFKGSFTGFHHDFVAYGDLKSNLGNVSTDISVKIKDGTPYYKGKVSSNHFRVGQLMGIPKDLGDITMNVNVDGKGASKKELDAAFKGNIAQVVVKGYEYNNVSVNGGFSNQTFTGFLTLEDENIDLDFDGIVNLSGKLPEYHFVSHVKEAKLAKLNIIHNSGMKTRLSTTVEVNLIGNSPDNLIGDLKILNTTYLDKKDTIVIDSAYVESKESGGIRNINMTSEVLDAQLKGEFKFAELSEYLENFFVRYVPSQIDKKHHVANLPHDLDFTVKIHNSALLSKLFLHGVSFADHTSVEGHYNSSTHVLNINGKSPLVDLYGIKMKQLNLLTTAKEEKIDLDLNVLSLMQSDSLYVNDFKIAGTLEKDTGLTHITWNKSDSVRNEGDISISTKFDGYSTFTNSFINSHAYFSDSLWTIRPNNKIVVDTGNIWVNALNMASGHQSILIDGKLSDDPLDQIDVLLKKFNLSLIDKLIPASVIDVNGVVDGVASISRREGEMFYTSDLEFAKLRVNKTLIGDGHVSALWNTTTQSLKLNGKFYRDHTPTILFSGNYYPKSEENNLDISLQLNRTELSSIEAYIKDNISNISGVISAKVDLKGSFKHPELSGSATVQNAKFKVNYLNTLYRTNLCQIEIVPDMISFDNIEIFDERNNKATANGTVFHQWFNDWSVDIGLDARNFMALNTTEKDNDLYYGRAFVSGFFNVGSYDKQMTLDAEIKTEKNTVLNIPLTDNQDIEESNFIEFVSHDSTEMALNVNEQVDLTNIEMNFDIEITPNAQVRLVFDDQIGDVMRSTGEGNITLNISNDGDLNMYGSYEVIDGDYLFTLQNVINKRFDLEQGGTIKWNGSPYEAELNITAVYRLRARLYDLLVNVDTSDVYKKRIPVDLKLKMQHDMMNPDISFDIDLPTADEDTKNKMKSVLYVSGKEENIQELNKQVFSLLVLNSFLPPAGADATYGHANVGSTTSSELLSNQLSNWLSKISNDFDIGVNYRPGDELSGQELELALSTQLLNDRLILDGNFGVSDRNNVSSSAQNTNNLIGDLSMEYKITKDGKLRAKAFNNSNQFSFQNNNSAYTQGLGLSYKEEYDTGKEFWQKLFARFRRKNKKEEEN